MATMMELQRSALLMYTSCGWFFDDVSRIETVQILRMNLSGKAVAALARFYKIAPQEILVAHDELDLPAGETPARPA